MQTSGREFRVIDRYFRRSLRHNKSVNVAIGDDCAIITPTPGMQQAITIDTSIAGRHFPADAPAYLIGRRALNVSLSDLAAVGATPRWFTLALSLPAIDEIWLDDFARGLFDAADAFAVALIGGDTTRSDQLVISTQAHGELPQGEALLRSGARAGDTIYVTGPLGSAGAGLALYQQQKTEPKALLDTYLDPTPQVDSGLKLRGLASSCIDISDGLLADLGHILAASGVGASLDLAAIPLADENIQAFDNQQALQWALSAGDDYQLCFTSGHDKNTLAAHGIKNCHAIGEITAEGGMAFLNRPAWLNITTTGFDHFNEPSI